VSEATRDCTSTRMLARFVNAADFFDPPLDVPPLCPMLNPVGFGVKSNVELAFECGASSGASTVIGSGDGGSGDGISISSAGVSSTTVVSVAAAAAGVSLSNCAFKSRIARGRSLRPRPPGVRFIGLGEVLVGIAEN